MTKGAHVPEGWPTMIPRIVARDSSGLVDFAKRVFGAGGEYHAERPTELRIGDSLVMISEAGERDARSAFLYVYVEDTDEVFRRATEAGARVVEAPTDMPYGDRRAMIEDAWGNAWQIATHRGAFTD